MEYDRNEPRIFTIDTSQLNLVKSYTGKDIAYMIKALKVSHDETWGKVAKTFPEKLNDDPEVKLDYEEAVNVLNASIDFLKQNNPPQGERGYDENVLDLAKVTVMVVHKIQEEYEKDKECWKNVEKNRECSLAKMLEVYQQEKDKNQELLDWEQKYINPNDKEENQEVLKWQEEILGRQGINNNVPITERDNDRELGR